TRNRSEARIDPACGFQVLIELGGQHHVINSQHGLNCVGLGLESHKLGVWVEIDDMDGGCAQVNCRTKWRVLHYSAVHEDVAFDGDRRKYSRDGGGSHHG